MKVETLDFNRLLKDISNIYDDNVEVIVKLENQREYIVTVITPQNLVPLINEKTVNFLGPSVPLIIVRKLMKEIIEEIINAYAEFFDAYWLKYHHFANKIKHEMFEELQKKENKD